MRRGMHVRAMKAARSTRLRNVYLAAAAHLVGLLLWPAVAAHGVVTLLLVAGREDDRQMARGLPS